jgi:protein TonB
MKYTCIALLLLLTVRLHAQENFCAICSREAWAGDSVALNKFMTGCGVVDTVGYDSSGVAVTTNPVYKKVTMKLNSGKVLFSDEIFIVPDRMPQFVGGDEALLTFLSKNIHYPAKAGESKIQGTVFIQFIVEKDGAISHVQIKRSIDAELDAEAARVVKSLPKWKSGQHKGKAVRVQMALPVRFKLG